MGGRHRAQDPARHSRRPATVAGWLVLASGLIALAVVQVQTGSTGLTASAFSGADPTSTALTTTRMVAPSPDPVVGEPDELAPSTTSAVADEEVEPPFTLAVDAIGVESVIQPLGLNDDGSLEVPARGPLYDQAGWYTGSPRPGEVGPSVLLGHVDGRGGAPSVFFRLSELRAGQLVTVAREDGSQARFEVYRVEQYPKDTFPTDAVYGDTTEPELRLITCAGDWDTGAGHYRDNTVVYARFIADS